MAWSVVVRLPLSTPTLRTLFHRSNDISLAKFYKPRVASCRPPNRSLSDELPSARCNRSLCGGEEFVEDLRLKRRFSSVRTAMAKWLFYESNRLAGFYRKTLKERLERRIVDIDVALRGEIDGGAAWP